MYIKTEKFSEGSSPWHYPAGTVFTEKELIAGPEEIEDAFYDAWADEFTREITVIDDVSEFDIFLNAEEYFTDGVLTLVEDVILDALSTAPEEVTAENIKRYVESKGKFWTYEKEYA